MNTRFESYPHGARQLMITAERLFGEMGIEGVSVRQLLIAAKQANKSAVQHYFGSKEGLVQAVREMRLPELDQARQRWFDTLAEDSPNSSRELVAALFMPMLEIMNDADLESFAQFNLRLLHSDISDRSFLNRLTASPATQNIVTRLHGCFPDMPLEVFKTRLRLAVGVFLGGVGEWCSLTKSHAQPYESMDAYWTDILQMAAAVLWAPRAGETSFSVTVIRPQAKTMIE